MNEKKNKDVESSGARAEDASPKAKQKPVHVVRLGDVSVSIFAHESKSNGTVNYSWSPQRSYKDAFGKWRHSAWFSPEEFGTVAMAIQKAEEWYNSDD